MRDGTIWGYHDPLMLPRRIYRSVRRRVGQRLHGSEAAGMRVKLLEHVAAHPADPEGHYRLAQFYVEHGRALAAAAECRTSLKFGGGKPAADLFARAYASGDYDGEGIFSLAPTVYQRNKGLASRIRARYPHEHPTILDVGGGDGILSLFLPQCDYALAEPSVNGLLVSHFPERSFDVAAACHVFEHIPADQKKDFLRQLCSVARRTVLLLGPFETGEHQADATALIYKITGAKWAREHLDCGIPSPDLITGFAAEEGIPCTVSLSGNRMSVYWSVFAEHFARCAGKVAELREVQSFADKYWTTGTAHAAEPEEHMIELDLERRIPP
jgi:hypothetical protein